MTGPINTVDTDAMLRAAAWLDDASGELEKQRQQVLSTVDALIASWTGPAANTFNGALNQWSDTFKTKIIIEVANMADIMRGQVPDNQAGEDTNVQTVSQFFGDLNPR